MAVRGLAGRFVRALTLAVTLSVAFAVPARAEFEFLTEWGAPKGGELIAPFDVERDSAGNAYVVDLLNRGVHKFDSANNLLLHWGSFGTGPGQFGFPMAVGLNVATGEVYVADLSGFDPASATVRIERFGSSGSFLGEFGSFGTAEGQFGGFVRGISVDPSGNVFVADSSNQRIQQFDAAGTFVRMWGRDVVPGGGTGFEECTAGCKEGEPGTAEGEFDFPTDVAASGFGIFVSDQNNHRIQRFNLAGGQVNFLVMGGKDVQPGAPTGAETCSSGCKAGVSGDQNGELSGPNGLDVDNVPPGHVWVADGNNDRVQRFNLGLTYEAKFGSQGSGDGQFRSPLGLAEGGGQVVVTDGALYRAQRFDGIAGVFQSRFGEPGDSTLVSPAGIGTGPGGVYVTDQRHRVTRFDPDGAFLGFWGEQGSAVGEFRFPDGVGGDAGGNVYVVDRVNSRIQRFDATGAALGAWGSAGTASGQFDGPRDVAIGPDGSVYVVEQNTHRVQKFTPIGGFLGTWGAEGSANGQFDDPLGIATDLQGNVYVADTGNDRVQKFDADGSFLASWGSEGSADGQFKGPGDLATDSLGNVFVVDRDNHRVQRFDSAGNFLGRWGANGGDGTAGSGPGELFTPNGISVDSAGDIYVLDGANNRVQKFAGAAAPADGTAPPELDLGGKKRQKAGRLKVLVDCGGPPCTVELSGKVVARLRRGGGSRRALATAAQKGKRRKLTRKLKPTTATLATGETATARLKLKRHGRSVRRIKRLLKRGGRGKAVVRGVATNLGGSGKDKVKVKLKRPRSKKG